LVLGGAAAQVLHALAGLLVARLAGPDAYGDYALAYSLAGAFGFVFLFGLDGILVREVARTPAQVGLLFWSAAAPVLLVSSGLLVLILSLAPGLGYSPQVRAVLLSVAPAVALKALAGLPRAALRGLERFDLDARIQTLAGGFTLILVGFGLSLSTTANGAALGLLAGQALGLSLALLTLQPHLRAKGAYRWAVSFRLVKQAMPLGFAFTLVGAGLRLEMLVLGRWATANELGLYAAALNIAMLPRALSLVSAAFLPRLALAYPHGRRLFVALFKWGWGLHLLLAAGLGLALNLSAKVLLELFYGPSFTTAAPALRLLSAMSALLFLNTYAWQALIALRRPSRIALAALPSLSLAGSLAALLVPRLGITGAALAALARELCQLALLVLFLLKEARASS
jgi:O-antigen/teichoic acid export membrane protein